MELETLNIHVQKNEVEPLHYAIYKKVISKWIKNLSVTLRRKHRTKLPDIRCDNDFSDMAPKVKIGKIGLHQN